MLACEIVNSLSDKLLQTLPQWIGCDYWLIDVPHHANVGDTLIWQGEIDFLRRLPYTCKGMSSFDSMKMPLISKNGLVLFHGGGNFGDLWDVPHNYQKRIMAANPSCRFVVLPQTVWYGSADKLKEDAEFYSKYDCTICARDSVSFALLEKNFKNKILLVPDMAFCMDMSKWWRQYSASRPLVLKRSDKELNITAGLQYVLDEVGADICDWPPMVNYTLVDRVRDAIRRRPRKLGFLYEPYMCHVYRPYLIRSGVRLINSHTDIYTTRLHACILSILLGKEKIIFFDNSYGKNRNFYDTWLNDCDSVRMM